MDERDLRALFPRIHAIALGASIGLVTGAALFILTAIHVLFTLRVPIFLLSQYLVGYDVSWAGAFVGLAWGLVIGFVAGWLAGSVHNATIAVWVRVLRARTDLSRSRDLIDQFR